MDEWNRQIKLAQYMLLGTVITTALNIAFLLGNVDMYINYCAALPYYLVWFGKIFDNGAYLGAINGEFTATAMVLAGVLLAIWLVIWWLARDGKLWLQIGFVTVLADLGLWALLALGLFGDLLSFFWDLVLHVAVLWEMWQGLKAWKRKDAIATQQSKAEQVAECV